MVGQQARKYKWETTRTDLVGSVSVSDDPVGSDDERIDLVVLEERADHGVGEEGGGDLESEQLQRGETGACGRKRGVTSQDGFLVGRMRA